MENETIETILRRIDDDLMRLQNIIGVGYTDKKGSILGRIEDIEQDRFISKLRDRQRDWLMYGVIVLLITNVVVTILK